MPLSRLVYFSRLVSSDARVFDDILRVSRRNNERDGLTGVLVEADSGFLQVIEGRRGPLTSVLGRILADPRHERVRVIEFRQIDERAFGSWVMYALRDSGLFARIIHDQREAEDGRKPALSPNELVAVLRFLVKNDQCDLVYASEFAA